MWFVYMLILGFWFWYFGVVKVDLGSGRIVGWCRFVLGCFGSELCFVFWSREVGVVEDDGYVVMYYYDENMGEVELFVIDV